MSGGEALMHIHARFALGHPVFDPERQITTQHGWYADRLISAMMTVNIGHE